MTAPWSPEEKAEEERRLANLVTPKNVAPSLDTETGKVTLHPISGMVQLIPGLSSAYIVDGVPMTSSACHTLASIKEQYPELYPTVLEKAVHLAIGTWGNKAQNIVPVYSFQGKNHNARSSNQNGSDCPDGSFSEAGTVMDVSAGVFMPSSQSNTTAVKEQMAPVLCDVSDLYDIMIKISLSKAEYELVKWQATTSNTISFGGFRGAACTSVQLNISSSKRPLKESLGFQGAMHVDDLDAISGYTVFNLLMRIPPGTNKSDF